MSTNDAARNWLQYTHLEKVYGYLPGIHRALPGIFDMTPEEYEETRQSFETAARAAASELLRDERVADLVDTLPVRAGQRILAVGDSITDDLQSWAEILRHLLQIRRSEDAITVINAGLSAHTTAMVLRRWPATLAAKPDLVICALGGNDVTRVGPDALKSQVSLSETLANLRELRRIADALTTTAWVWMTPVPVHEERVANFDPFKFGLSTWRNADITALAEAVLTFDDPVVDLVSTFGVPADPRLQGPDGVHASLTGQMAITRALLERLGVHADRGEKGNP
ncbi:MAG: SGNH/GDSL hydrolase family protein [Nocardioidaceae bacterium]